MVLGADGALVFATSAGAGWLEEFGRPQFGLPVEVHALAARIRRELVSRSLHEHYLPRAEFEQQLGPSGSLLA